MSKDSEGALSALHHERRHFAPPPELAAAANAQPGIYEEASADPIAVGTSIPPS